MADDVRNGGLVVVKVLFMILAIAFVALQVYYYVKPGGTMELYGFVDSFNAWADVSLSNPITAAAFIDLITMMIATGFVIGYGVPPHKGRVAAIVGLILLLCVFPGLALLIYLLAYWRRPEQFRP